MNSDKTEINHGLTATNQLDGLSILVVSCDNYSDIWPYFFQLFDKYWPDCPTRVFLGSNVLGCDNPRIENLLIGKDISWADSARKMVGCLPTEYFLFLLEDFFLRKPVDTKTVIDCLKALKQLDGGYLRLRPFPKPDRFLASYPRVGMIDIGAPYRLALQAAIWRRDIFLDLIQPGESAWDMEIIGSRRSDKFELAFYCTWQPVIEYYAAITLGKWSPLGVKICEEEHMEIDYKKRSQLEPPAIRKLYLRRLINAMTNIVPWKLRRKLKQFLKFQA
jgi:hypothetical protein